MRLSNKRPFATAVPIVVSAALVLAACGSGDESSAQSTQVTTEEAAAASVPAASDTAPAAEEQADTASAPKAKASDTTKRTTTAAAPDASAKTRTSKAGAPATAADPAVSGAKKATAAKGAAKESGGGAGASVGFGDATSIDTAAERKANQEIYEQKNGATDVGVTKTDIRLGSISMHGMALGNVLVTPLVNGMKAALSSINDRGGVLGRRLSVVTCDDGPGEVSRTKACVKKLAGQDRVFSLISGATWGTASIHDDLKQWKLPYVGAWAYSQTEWQDPYMFPAHMSMIHEAMAGGNWARNVIKPKTYGLICLTSPEMQLACNQVAKILDASGAKLVKKADVSISETSMSSHVLSLRAANPEHVIHYVINPATMAKFIVEAAQQNYYPPKGISGNHLAAEVLGSIFGKHPAGRYWTNTTYKLWGAEFMSTMNKYARGNKGINHHIVQASYVAAYFFARAAKAIGPNLTQERMMAQLGNGDVYATDASLDQKFSWRQTERTGDDWDKYGAQGREFMYKYTSHNTVSNPDGSPSGFQPDPDQFVIYTWK